MAETVLPSPETVGVVPVTRISLPRRGKDSVGEKIDADLTAIGSDGLEIALG